MINLPFMMPQPTAHIRKRVLVAEDNAVNFKVVSAMLDKLGYSADWAKDGKDAVVRFAESNLEQKTAPYALILMDYEMPGLNGLQATQCIRQIEIEHNTPRIPIITLTAHVTGDSKEQCRCAGMDFYLSKPIEMSLLAQTLSQALGLHQN